MKDLVDQIEDGMIRLFNTFGICHTDLHEDNIRFKPGVEGSNPTAVIIDYGMVVTYNQVEGKIEWEKEKSTRTFAQVMLLADVHNVEWCWRTRKLNEKIVEESSKTYDEDEVNEIIQFNRLCDVLKGETLSFRQYDGKTKLLKPRPVTS